MAGVLGGFEHRVLLAMMRLGGRGYSVPVLAELEEHTGRRVAPAAVYVTLRRLEKRGLLTSEMTPPADGQGGRDRRVFAVTPEAVDLMIEARRDLDRLWAGVAELELP